MRGRVWLLSGWLIAGGAIAGCGHSQSASGGASEASAAAASFDAAWEAVRSGAKESARYGQYVIDRTADGAVRVYREARAATQSAGERVSDAAVSAAVKARLASTSGVKSGDIDVSTDAGVVTLKGTVADSVAAARAVQTAMDTSGVFAVNSELQVEGTRTGQRTPSSPGAL